MIRGIGVDIIEIDRLHKSVDRFGGRLLGRLFTRHEIEYCEAKFNRYQHFAARFAAKEAFSKAAGTGLTEKFSWKDVEVVNDQVGKPHIELHGSLKETFKEARLLLSMSHSESHVVAMVVLEVGA